MHNTEENNVKALVFASIISADNPHYTEDAKQEAMYRYNLETANLPHTEDMLDDLDWEFILEPVGADNRLLELFK